MLNTNAESQAGNSMRNAMKFVLRSFLYPVDITAVVYCINARGFYNVQTYRKNMRANNVIGKKILRCALKIVSFVNYVARVRFKFWNNWKYPKKDYNHQQAFPFPVRSNNPATIFAFLRSVLSRTQHPGVKSFAPLSKAPEFPPGTIANPY